MRRITGVAGTAAVVAAVFATTASPAAAVPDKKLGALPVHVWCPDGTATVYTDTPYVTSQIGASPVWLHQNDGSVVKTALIYAAEYQVFVEPVTPSSADWTNGNGVFLFDKTLGNKSGYASTIHCIHFANWGTVDEPYYLEGPIDLAVVPSQG